MGSPQTPGWKIRGRMLLAEQQPKRPLRYSVRDDSVSSLSLLPDDMEQVYYSRSCLVPNQTRYDRDLRVSILSLPTDLSSPSKAASVLLHFPNTAKTLLWRLPWLIKSRDLQMVAPKSKSRATATASLLPTLTSHCLEFNVLHTPCHHATERSLSNYGDQQQLSGDGRDPKALHVLRRVPRSSKPRA